MSRGRPAGARQGGWARTATMSAAFAGPVRHVYAHVPFCTARCDYCDFFSVVQPAADGPVLDAYVDAVAAEWERERVTHGVRRLETLYLGGGTPALLGAERLERLVRCFDAWLTPRAEVTVETNPDEADDAFAAWAAARRVRVSLGVQSFDPALRAALGRRPAADPAVAARRLRAAGVRDLSVDLIHGVPGQTIADLDADLAAIAELVPDHVSWYELGVVEGTPLAKRLGAREGLSDTRGDADAHEGPPSADDDARAALYRYVVRGLGRLGYRWYEVSNFARPGRRARHNMAYWRARPYLGLGAGAVSTVGGRRWRNAPDVRAYVEALDGAAEPPREIEALDGATLSRERLLLAARCGLPLPLTEVAPAIDQDAVTALVAAGLLSLHSGTIRVTRKGRYVANEVCVRLFRA